MMIRFLILVLAIAQLALADPDGKFLTKAFGPAVKPLGSAANPSHTIAQVPAAAAGNIGTIDQSAVSTLRAEIAIAKLKEEDKVMMLDLEHLQAQIQQMEGLQGQKQTPTDGQADMAGEETQYSKLVLGVGALGLASVAAYSLIKSRAGHSPLSGRRMAPVAMKLQDETGDGDSFDVARCAAPQMTTTLDPPKGWRQLSEEMWGPDKKADQRVEGGSTVRTFKMPPGAERVQYILTAPGNRPVKGKAELWIGPIRCVHELLHDSVDGKTFPIKSTLKFKPLEPVLKISTHGEYECPLQYGVFVPDPDESKKIDNITSDFFYNAPLKEAVQGGSTIDSKGGQIRSFKIPNEWKKVQIMVWSKDVASQLLSKPYSFKTNIEALQGPNSIRQHFNLRCGGSTQPYHTVIDTPGSNWTIRLNSKKYMEDGRFEVAVGPYGELDDSEEGEGMGGRPMGASPMGYGPFGPR